MKANCNISDFYLFLKLGMWKAGLVSDWGEVSSIIVLKNEDTTEYNSTRYNLIELEKYSGLRKPISYYLKQTYAKHLPAIGIYLLDSYLLNKKHDKQGVFRIYIVVISTSRFGLDNKEYTYILKVSNHLDELSFKSLMNGGTKKRNTKSYSRRKTTSRRFDFKPIHAKEL